MKFGRFFPDTTRIVLVFFLNARQFWLELFQGRLKVDGSISHSQGKRENRKPEGNRKKSDRKPHVATEGPRNNQQACVNEVDELSPDGHQLSPSLPHRPRSQ